MGRRYTALRHPFVIEPDVGVAREVGEGDPLRLCVVLLGSAIEQAPYLIHALNLGGERGLGRAGPRFSVAAVEREGGISGQQSLGAVYAAGQGEYRRLKVRPPVVPPPPEMVRVRLVTPFRVKRRGRFVGAGEFEVADLLRNLCARLTMLSDLYGGDPRPFEWTRLAGETYSVQLADVRLHWHEWTRYSSRQQTRMQMGGLLAVTGLSPQVVTETLYALAVARRPAFVPTEIQLLTTAEGAERVGLSLLSPDPGWFARLLRDYALPPIAFGSANIHVLRDVADHALNDIRTLAENERAADVITGQVRSLTTDPDSALHV